MRITIPLRVSSKSNARQHWATRARVAKSERQITGLIMLQHPELGRVARAAIGATAFGGPPLVVRLVRCAPRALDDDNLRDALKSVRDELAAQFGLASDRDERVVWEYGQRNGPGESYAVAVEIK